MNGVQDLTGQRFGKLLVVSYVGQMPCGGQKKTTWRCVCDCGGTTDCHAGNLKLGGAKSCGCSHKRHNSISPNWIGHEGLSGSFYSQIRNGALSRGLTFNVSMQFLWDMFLMQGEKCALSGVPISLSKAPRRSKELVNTASLDRISSLDGYENSNVQWVHKDVNLMKNKFDQPYFVEMCKRIANHP